MPLAGFVCPLTNENVGFDTCIYTCKHRCIELPILLSFMEEREKVDGVFSATELQKPPRIVAWERKNDYYLNPFDMVWATFGTAYHAVVASQRDMLKALRNHEHYSIEDDNFFTKQIEVDGKTYTLRGTPDQYESSSHTLTDYKTLKYYYDVKFMLEKGEVKPEYLWQLNIYRWAEFPDCKTMRLEALVKDWNRRVRDEANISPIVRIAVPILPDNEVEAHIKDSIRGIVRAMDGDARDCTEDERWTRNIRCEEYCLVGKNGQCPQWEALKGETNGQAGNHGNRTRGKGSRKL